MVIPALPEKRMATKLVSLGPEFVAQRCAALDAFLKRCAAHATLRASPHLTAFLEAPEGAWAAQAAVPLPRDALTLAKQREAQGPLGAAALKELGRNAAALLAGRPDANDAEYDRVSARTKQPLSAARNITSATALLSAADYTPRLHRADACVLHGAGQPPDGVPAVHRQAHPTPRQYVPLPSRRDVAIALTALHLPQSLRAL